MCIFTFIRFAQNIFLKMYSPMPKYSDTNEIAVNVTVF